MREIIDARLGTQSSPAEGPARPIKLLFNSSAESSPERFQEHMRELERMVARRAERSNGRLKFSFASGSSFDLKLRPR